MPNPDPIQGRGKWITLALLAAVAVFLYVSVILKITKHGF